MPSHLRTRQAVLPGCTFLAAARTHWAAAAGHLGNLGSLPQRSWTLSKLGEPILATPTGTPAASLQILAVSGALEQQEGRKHSAVGPIGSRKLAHFGSCSRWCFGPSKTLQFTARQIPVACHRRTGSALEALRAPAKCAVASGIQRLDRSSWSPSVIYADRRNADPWTPTFSTAGQCKRPS